MNVYIKIEIKDREFISRTLIAAYLAQKGHDVYVGDDELFGRYLENKILNPGIILEKSISPVKAKIRRLKLLKKNKFKVASLDEEGGLNNINYTMFAKQRYSAETLKISDIAFCWGKYDYRMNRKIFPKFKKKFFISGNPRFDFYNKAVKKNQRMEKKIVIIPSTFTLTANKRIVEDFDIWKKLRKTSLDDQTDWFYEARIRSMETYDLLSLIYEIKKKFKKILIEVWVHPKENIDNWRKIIPEDRYMKYTKEKNFDSTSSDKTIFIFTGSTLGMDVILNKGFLVHYKSTKIKYANIPMKLAKKITNLKTLVQLIKTFYKKKRKLKKQKDQIEDFIHNSRKNIFASSIIANKIHEINSKDISKKNTFLKNNLNHLYFKNYLRLIRQKIDYQIYNDKFPPFTNSEINKVYKKLINFNKDFKKINIKLVGPKLIRITKK